jgi:hypothetical protein
MAYRLLKTKEERTGTTADEGETATTALAIDAKTGLPA